MMKFKNKLIFGLGAVIMGSIPAFTISCSETKHDYKSLDELINVLDEIVDVQNQLEINKANKELEKLKDYLKNLKDKLNKVGE